MTGNVVVLTGGVGGAKLVLGLARSMPASDVVAIVNTGDDFRHLGLWVSPDIDTVLYTLSGRADLTRGWGRHGETWSFMDAIRSLGQDEWFALGDGDLALHVLRSRAMSEGRSLSQVTADFAQAWGVATRVAPMSDDPVSTVLDTDEGELAFQDYFVRRRCAPKVRRIRFQGADAARVSDAALEALGGADIRAILIAPSNPYLSIDPILAVPGMREALRAARAPVVAVSPLVGGRAVKGPTAKLMGELGVETTPQAIAAHYARVIDGLLVDLRDDPAGLALPHAQADTLMRSVEDRMRVARAALDLADRLAR